MPPLQPQDVGIGQLFWSIRDAVVVGDARTGRIVMWSPSAASMFGYTEAEALGRSIETLVPPQFQAQHRAGLARYSMSGHGALIDSNAAVEVSARRKDGEEIVIELTLTPIEHAPSPEDRLVLALIRDVTERKRADRAQLQLASEQAARLAAETAEGRQRFLAAVSGVLTSSLDAETILQSMAQLMIPTLGDWCIVDVVEGGAHVGETASLRRVATAAASPHKENLLRVLQRRYPTAWHSPQPASRAIRAAEPLIFSPLTEELLTEELLTEELLTEELLTASTVDAEHRGLIRELAPRSILAVPLIARGQTLGAISLAWAESDQRYDEADLAFVQDLARRCALALDNARLYQQAQDAIHIRDEFLSVASHELRTPITSLQGFTQLLLRRLDKGSTIDSNDLRRRLDMINTQADKLRRLIAQLLDISRLEADKLVLDRSITDVAALVERVAASARIVARRHAITVHAPSPVVALVDPLRLEQVVTNLVDNAIKYSPAGGPIAIEVALDQPTLGEPETDEPATVRIVVQDSGIGIAPDQQRQIFERFYQAHAHDYRSGMGLGLYICRQIVDLHGGSIAIDSLAEQGTRVTIRLPRRV